MKEFVVYTLMRIGLFVTSLVVVIGVWAAVNDNRVPVFLAVIVAFAISGVASYFLLNRQREAFAQRVQARADRMSERYDAMRTKEDVEEERG